MPKPDEMEHEVIKPINTGKFDKPEPASPRPKLTLVKGARDQRKQTHTAAIREDPVPSDASDLKMPYAHAGAIARAMKTHPGLTYEEALEMAKDFGF
jgi:hypothetical protein